MHSSPIGPSQPIKFLHQFATRGGVVYYYTLGKNAAGPLIFFAAARTSDEVHDFTFIAQSISCMYNVQYIYIAWESDKRIIL